MIKRASMPLSAKQISKMMNNNKLCFDNVVQRGLTWEKSRKSLLIHSMAMGYPIPALYSARKDSGVYDILDGKQRCHAIHEYLTDKFKLTEVPPVITEDGEVVEITGLKFSELPEEIRDIINDYSINNSYFDGITQEEIVEMFSRLNNGKPLTAIELTRVKAKSMDKIKELAQHDIFKESMSEKKLGGFKNEDVVIKSWIVMYNENKSLDTKNVRPVVENMEITQEQIEEMTEVFDRLQDVHFILSHSGGNKIMQLISKRVYTMTHLISLTPIALQSIKDGLNEEDFAEIVKDFFSPEDVASISDKYNAVISAGANKKESVEVRLNELKEHYDKEIEKLLA